MPTRSTKIASKIRFSGGGWLTVEGLAAQVRTHANKSQIHNAANIINA